MVNDLDEDTRWNLLHINNDPDKPLKNKLGISNQKDLDQIERLVVSNNTKNLSKIKQTFDVAHLKAIHRTLFGDVYDWAGEFRNINMMKGLTAFEEFKNFDTRFNEFFQKLKQENYYKNLSIEQFTKKITNLLAELNDIHPFREGNGRTQRAFINDLATKNGYYINWERMDKQKMIEASKISMLANDNSQLERLISRNIVHLDSMKQLMGFSKDMNNKKFFTELYKNKQKETVKIKRKLKR